MERKALLGQISFGSQVAEDERRELARYFVETDQWKRIFGGEVDIVRGEKGSGKSAIYSLLTERDAELFDNRVLISSGENPRGDTVFRNITPDPPNSEVEFIVLWKLYVLCIVAKVMRNYDLRDNSARLVYSALEEDGLIDPDTTLAALLNRVQRTVKRLMRQVKFDGTATVDVNTGTPVVSGKISIGEPTDDARKKGARSLDELFSLLDSSLKEADFRAWVLLDRLDVAFIDNHTLEENALRALMRVYSDIRNYDSISLKIFIREDIWKRITYAGFREASHITRFVVLGWDRLSLLNLLMRRALSNDLIVGEFGINTEEVLKDASAQEALFGRLFPAQVEQGERKSSTFDWMINRCADGTKKTAPRELVHLLNCLREQEARRLERGGTLPPDDQLFYRSVFKQALPTVSETRLYQYLYAEYPAYRRYIEMLDRQKTEQTPASLAGLWGSNVGGAIKTARELVALGFFEERGTREEPTFWVPFLYRDALRMVQGKAGETGKAEGEEEEE
jgi:hypothetical protein